MTNGASAPDNRDCQITTWWHEAEDAVCSARPARARRLLRWIVTCEPGEEEAWLALAHLAPSQQERIRILNEAYTLHPQSRRVVSRLSEARTEYLASSVGDLVRPRSLIRCLPDERRQPPSTNGASHNGHHAHPLDQVGYAPSLLSRVMYIFGLL